MAGLFEIANEIAVLFGARNLEWSAIADEAGVPTGATDGESLPDTVAGRLNVSVSNGLADVDVYVLPKDTTNGPDWSLRRRVCAVDSRNRDVELEDLGGVGRIAVHVVNQTDSGASITMKLGLAIKE